MRIAFEITSDDVSIVMDRTSFQYTIKPKNLVIDADTLFDELDQSSIEKAALYGNDMDEQTTLAHNEIERQLVDIITNR